MNSEAFAVWSSLFDEGVKGVWLSECKELKCAAMVLHALKRELKKLENSFDAKLNNYREKLLNNKQSGDEKVEKVKRKIFPIAKPANVLQTKQQSVLETSLNDTTQVSELDQAISGVECEFSDSDITKIGTPSQSPKITKNQSVLKRKKANAQLTPSILNFKNTSADTSLNLLHINTTTPKNQQAECVPDFLESSIIETTPLVNVAKKRKKKENATKTSKNATLTQMFADNDTTFVENNEPLQTGVGVDGGGGLETEEAACNSGDADSMFIDEILDYINRDNAEKAAKSNNVGMDGNNLGAANNQPNCYPIQKPNQPQNCMYKPKTVRGKARMELPGWSCKQCRDFYEALGLTPDELQIKMDECSKHRGKFAPPDDTPPGFWDMTLPPTPSTFYE